MNRIPMRTIITRDIRIAADDSVWILEVARLESATPLQTFFHIKIRYLSSTLMFVSKHQRQYHCKRHCHHGKHGRVMYRSPVCGISNNIDIPYQDQVSFLHADVCDDYVADQFL